MNFSVRGSCRLFTLQFSGGPLQFDLPAILAMIPRQPRLDSGLGTMADAIIRFGCGQCLVAMVAAPDAPGLTGILTCPKCGRSDSLESVAKEISDCAQAQLQKAFNSMTCGDLDASSNLTGKILAVEERIYRFVPLSAI